jgi:hypothetical protein
MVKSFFKKIIFVVFLSFCEEDHSQCEVVSQFELQFEKSIPAKLYCIHGNKFHIY